MKKEKAAKPPAAGLTPGLGSAPQPPPGEKSSRRLAIGSPEPAPASAGATEPLIGRPAAPGKPSDKAVRQVREVAAAVKRRQAARTKTAKPKR